MPNFAHQYADSHKQQNNNGASKALDKSITFYLRGI